MPKVQDEFKFSNFVFAFIVVLTQCVDVFYSPVVGYCISKYPPLYVGAINSILSVIGNILIIIAPNVYFIIAGALFKGVLSTSWMIVVALIDFYSPPESRSWWIGVQSFIGLIMSVPI
eukprot:UN34692